MRLRQTILSYRGCRILSALLLINSIGVHGRFMRETVLFSCPFLSTAFSIFCCLAKSLRWLHLNHHTHHRLGLVRTSLDELSRPPASREPERGINAGHHKKLQISNFSGKLVLVKAQYPSATGEGTVACMRVLYKPRGFSRRVHAGGFRLANRSPLGFRHIKMESEGAHREARASISQSFMKLDGELSRRHLSDTASITATATSPHHQQGSTSNSISQQIRNP